MKKTIITLFSAFALMSCSDIDITGEWSIEKAMGVSTENAETPAFIHFEKNGNMNGNASVNSFMGSYSLNGENLTLNNIGMTKMMGASMEIEDAITNALNATAAIKTDGNKAYILNSQNDTIMVLVKK